MAARAQRNQGISPVGKVAILLVIFGIPLLFVFSSWGLSRLFEIAPYAVVGVVILIATIYTAHTVKLMYDFYQVSPPLLRFIPCICETTLIDVKYHMPCYILYLGTVIFLVLSQLPYNVMRIFGEGIALSGAFYFMLIAIVLLTAIQVIKGIGLARCLKDIESDWKKINHTDLGAIDRMIILGFIPFVRVIALYSLNKPLSTMVEFMNVSIDDASEEGNDFYEEE